MSDPVAGPSPFSAPILNCDAIPNSARILVGYSGGPDSTCLLFALKERGFQVVAGHLNHGQRPEAADEQERLGAFCEAHGIEFVAGTADIPRMSAELKIGIEEAGREARYQFFTSAATQTGCDMIATGHTRDDHAETVLLNLIRGTGLAGLAGIPAQRGNIVRPLLGVARADTVAYCRAKGLPVVEDPGNNDLGFARVRIRRRVLPELGEIQPQTVPNIVRTARIAEEEDRFLNGAAAAALEQSEIPLNAGLRFLSLDSEVAFRRDALTGLPPVLFRRAIRLAVKALGGSLDYDQTLAILAGMQTDRGAITGERGTVLVEWDTTTLFVQRTAPAIPYRYNLTVPGETISDEFGWQFVAFPEAAPDIAGPRATMATHLALSAIVGQLHFRTVADGDTMRPRGFDGARKLSDLLSEAGLTRIARRRLPIVADMVGLLWAPGVCVDQRAQAQPGEPAIRVTFGPIG